MAAVNSTMLPLGTIAPEIELPDPSGTIVSLKAFDGSSAYAIMFICNHCPYVKMLRSQMAAIAREYKKRNVAFIAINSNDSQQYPDDSPEKMAQEVIEQGYDFPYLVDASQSVAKAYKAACTPDFYVFNSKLELTYRGQFDASRPGNDVTANGLDFRTAIDATIDNDTIPDDVQKPSIGCNIKWKPGNEPDYF